MTNLIDRTIARDIERFEILSRVYVLGTEYSDSSFNSRRRRFRMTVKAFYSWITFAVDLLVLIDMNDVITEMTRAYYDVRSYFITYVWYSIYSFR